MNSFDERDARLTYHPTFNYYRRLMPPAADGWRSNVEEEIQRYYYQNYPGAYQPRKGFSFPPLPSQSPSIRSSTEKKTAERKNGRKSICDSSFSGPAAGLFRQVRSRTRLKSHHIQRSLIVASLDECERECLEESQFKCMSFNFMPQIQAALPANCDLSHRHFPPIDAINHPDVLEMAKEYDFYARDESRSIDPCVDGKKFSLLRSRSVTS